MKLIKKKAEFAGYIVLYCGRFPEWRCPDKDCGMSVMEEYKCCPYCGRRLKFDKSKKMNFSGCIENMDKTTLHFFTAIKNGEVKHIGKSIIIQPEVKFGGGTIKWFDDKQLVKKK